MKNQDRIIGSTHQSNLNLPIGTSFREYNGDFYIAHPEFGLRRVTIGDAGEIELETPVIK